MQVINILEMGFNQAIKECNVDYIVQLKNLDKYAIENGDFSNCIKICKNKIEGDDGQLFIRPFDIDTKKIDMSDDHRVIISKDHLATNISQYKNFNNPYRFLLYHGYRVVDEYTDYYKWLVKDSNDEGIKFKSIEKLYNAVYYYTFDEDHYYEYWKNYIHNKFEKAALSIYNDDEFKKGAGFKVKLPIKYKKYWKSIIEYEYNVVFLKETSSKVHLLLYPNDDWREALPKTPDIIIEKDRSAPL